MGRLSNASITSIAVATLGSLMVGLISGATVHALARRAERTLAQKGTVPASAADVSRPDRSPASEDAGTAPAETVAVVTAHATPSPQSAPSEAGGAALTNFAAQNAALAAYAHQFALISTDFASHQQPPAPPGAMTAIPHQQPFGSTAPIAAHPRPVSAPSAAAANPQPQPTPKGLARRDLRDCWNQLGLTHVEGRVAQRILKGDAFSVIASDLGVSHDSIRQTASRIYRKAGVGRRNEFTARVVALQFEQAPE